MTAHTADRLLRQLLFWQQSTQTTEGEMRERAMSRFRGFVDACAITLGIGPSGTEAWDASKVFDRLRELSGVTARPSHLVQG